MAEPVTITCAQLADCFLAPAAAPTWVSIPLLTAVILAFSASVAFVGLSFTLLASRADTFRNLRVGFNTLRGSLPTRFWTLTAMPAKDEEFKPLVKYWQYAFDEWFITRKLNPLVFGRLWRVYYKDVITVACKSPVMIAALFQAAEGATAAVDHEFVKLVLSAKFTDPTVLAAAKTIATAAGIPVPARL